MVRREGFEPPAFWSVGCLTRKSEPFRLRFVLFTAIRSASFPLFPSRLARSVLGQNWVRSCREDKRRYRSRQKNLPQIPKNEKAFAPHVRVRCIILPRKKQAKTRAGLLRLHFMPKKTTFRAVLRTKRRKGAIVDTERKNPPGGAPRTRRGHPLRETPLPAGERFGRSMK